MQSRRGIGAPTISVSPHLLSLPPHTHTSPQPRPLPFFLSDVSHASACVCARTHRPRHAPSPLRCSCLCCALSRLPSVSTPSPPLPAPPYLACPRPPHAYLCPSPFFDLRLHPPPLHPPLPPRPHPPIFSAPHLTQALASLAITTRTADIQPLTLALTPAPLSPRPLPLPVALPSNLNPSAYGRERRSREVRRHTHPPHDVLFDRNSKAVCLVLFCFVF